MDIRVHFMILSFCDVIKLVSSSCETCVSDHLSDFDGKKVSDFPLGTFQGLEFIGNCAKICWDDVQCISYMFNKETGLCLTFAVGYSDVTNTFNPILDEAGNKLYAACGRSSHGGDCRQDEQCVGSNLECIDHTCKCTPGYSFYAYDNTCVNMNDCTYYGPSMAQYLGLSITDHNTRIINSVTSMEDCITACVSETPFLCLTVDYNPSTNTCYLANVGYLDVDPSSRQPNSAYEHASRNCIGSGHGRECTQDDACVVLNSECIDNKCKCTPGYSFNVLTYTCVLISDCTNYGPSMTQYLGLSIAGSNTRIIYSVTSIEDCITACVSETSFLCLSVDYNPSTNTCVLANVGYFDVDPSLRNSNTAYDHASRDCSDG